MSYSTCPNVKMHISKHNAKLLREEKAEEEKECKCLRKYPECPAQGECQTKSVVYKAEVYVPNVEMKSYIGLTKNEFIKRFEQHQTAMKNRNSPNATALSKYVWEIKDKIGVHPNIKWKIVTRAHSFSSGSRQCDLCLSEKREILYAKKRTSLNIRDELLYMCRHQIPFRLANFKPKPNKNKAKPKRQRLPAIT